MTILKTDSYHAFPVINEKIKNPGPIGIRVDANSRWGFGHIIRNLLLAQALRRHFKAKIIFFTKTRSLAEKEIKKQGFTVVATPPQEKGIHWAWTLKLLLVKKKVNQLIIDLPNPLSLKEISVLKQSDTIITLLDDVGPARNYADLCINAIDHLPYNPASPDDKKIIEGPQYMIIKPEYMTNYKTRPRKKIRRLLLTFGGGDYQNLTSWTLKTLAPLANALEIVCLIGPGYQFKKELQQFIDSKKISAKILGWPPKTLPLFQTADLVFTHFGVTVYELARLGLPAILIQPSQYHSDVADVFAKRGSIINLGYWRNLNPDQVLEKTRYLEDIKKRAILSKNGHSILDGRGLERVTKLIFEAKPTTP